MMSQVQLFMNGPREKIRAGAGVQRVEFEIYNAIGQHIFSTTLDVADGRNEIWNGSRHARGYYFFRIKYWDMQGVEFRERGKVLVVRQ